MEDAMGKEEIVREQLMALLEGGRAHMGFRDAISGFPVSAINTKVPNSTYTVWHLLEHMRIAQWDILEYVRNSDYVSPEFPDGYWPKPDEMATPSQWRKTVKEIAADLEEVEKIVKDPKTDFFGPIPHAKDCTIFQEVLLVSDHNAYHISELVTLRRVLNLKPIKEY